MGKEFKEPRAFLDFKSRAIKALKEMYSLSDYHKRGYIYYSLNASDRLIYETSYIEDTLDMSGSWYTKDLYGITVLKGGHNEKSCVFALRLTQEGIERFQEGWDLVYMKDLKALISF